MLLPVRKAVAVLDDTDTTGRLTDPPPPPAVLDRSCASSTPVTPRPELVDWLLVAPCVDPPWCP